MAVFSQDKTSLYYISIIAEILCNTPHINKRVIINLSLTAISLGVFCCISLILTNLTCKTNVVNKSYVLFPVTLHHLDISDGKLGQSCGQCSTDEKFTVHQELAHGRSAKNTRQNFYIPSLQSRNSRNPSRLNKLLEWTLYTIGTSRLCLGVGSSVQWEGLLKCQQQRKLPSLIAYTMLLAS